MIRYSSISTAMLLAAATGCASYPAPIQRMADAESATRAAEELGANNTPKAQLHLRLAQQETEQARTLIDHQDNKRADFTLVRANADAELAVALSRESVAEAQAKTAMQTNAALDQPAMGGATMTTTTTTQPSTAPANSGVPSRSDTPPAGAPSTGVTR